MTDAAQETTQRTKATRKRAPKGQSMPVMKELLGLMDERTKILAQIRNKKMEVAQLEAAMQALGTEIQWRANIFGMVQKQEGGDLDWNAGHPAPAFSPMPFPGAIGSHPVMTQPIFVQPQPPEPQRAFNRGSAAMDLAGIS